MSLKICTNGMNNQNGCQMSCQKLAKFLFLFFGKPEFLYNWDSGFSVLEKTPCQKVFVRKIIFFSNRNRLFNPIAEDPNVTLGNWTWPMYASTYSLYYVQDVNKQHWYKPENRGAFPRW